MCVGVAVGVGVGVAVAEAAAVGVAEAAAVGVAEAAAVGVAVAVGVGVGVGAVAAATTRYFESLGMPLVKTVTKAGPGGKLFTGVEVKEVSDQPTIGSTGRKATWLLSIARSWTTG